MPPGSEAVAAGAGGAGAGGPSVDLSTALTGEALQPLLSQEGFLDKVSWEEAGSGHGITELGPHNFVFQSLIQCCVGEGFPAGG